MSTPRDGGRRPRPEFLLWPEVPRRIKAAAIDGALAVGIFFGILYALRGLGLPSGSPVYAVAYLALFGYEPLMVTFRGRAIGHRLFDMRVADESTGGRVRLPRSIARWIVKAVLGWVSLLWIYGTERRRALHDIVGRSLVVEADVEPDEIATLPPAG